MTSQPQGEKPKHRNKTESMDLDIINRLFLELSQFSTATTARELKLENALKAIISEPHQDETTEMKLRLMAKEALRKP